MADISSAVNENRKTGIRQKKHSLKIDMTPMVDLGFLLISFFIITTELSKPRAMDLYMPHDGQPMPTKLSTSITFLLDHDNMLYYYYGLEENAGMENRIIKTSWDEEIGIGKIIREKQLELDRKGIGRDEMVVLIKPGTRSHYENMVDILDEMTIHRVKRYAIVDPGPHDNQWLESQ